MGHANALWKDTGNTNPVRTISITTATQIIAVYDCGTGTTSGPSVTIESVNPNGQTITGYWTVLYGAWRTSSTPDTTKTFTSLTAGATYSVELDSYSSCQFSHWRDNGATADERTSPQVGHRPSWESTPAALRRTPPAVGTLCP